MSVFYCHLLSLQSTKSPNFRSMLPSQEYISNAQEIFDNQEDLEWKDAHSVIEHSYEIWGIGQGEGFYLLAVLESVKNHW